MRSSQHQEIENAPINMKTFKLLAGIVITVVAMASLPYIFARLGWNLPLNQKAWLILGFTAGGLVVKTLVGDFAGGEFAFHKFGYDNCVMTFGAALTAVALQLNSSIDLFPGLDHVTPFSLVGGTDVASSRKTQLFIVLFTALVTMLITAKISNSIKNGSVNVRGLWALLNTIIGLAVLGFYVLILVCKG
ncbi:hypothetical protein [Paraburkholderia domus]|uniref:hypothetical protein n=1 Tax=Paraburkholderia domus TaxID=2793075 RepID=UPI001BA73083|nr:hypothetical protein [Paraburkholderia domus]